MKQVKIKWKSLINIIFLNFILVHVFGAIVNNIKFHSTFLKSAN